MDRPFGFFANSAAAPRGVVPVLSNQGGPVPPQPSPAGAPANASAQLMEVDSSGRNRNSNNHPASANEGGRPNWNAAGPVPPHMMFPGAGIVLWFPLFPLLASQEGDIMQSPWNPSFLCLHRRRPSPALSSTHDAPVSYVFPLVLPLCLRTPCSVRLLLFCRDLLLSAFRGDGRAPPFFDPAMGRMMGFPPNMPVAEVMRFMREREREVCVCLRLVYCGSLTCAVLSPSVVIPTPLPMAFAAAGARS